MKTLRATLSVLFVLQLASCAAPPLTISPSQRPYYDKAMAIPTTFKCSKEKAQDAWGRAQAFVATHSTMKIQVATDYVLQTYNVQHTGESGYALTRQSIGDSVQFTVTCTATKHSSEFGPLYHVEHQDINSHVLAYYMVSGEEPPTGLVYP